MTTSARDRATRWRRAAAASARRFAHCSCSMRVSARHSRSAAPRRRAGRDRAPAYVERRRAHSVPSSNVSTPWTAILQTSARRRQTLALPAFDDAGRGVRQRSGADLLSKLRGRRACWAGRAGLARSVDAKARLGVAHRRIEGTPVRCRTRRQDCGGLLTEDAAGCVRGQVVTQGAGRRTHSRRRLGRSRVPCSASRGQRPAHGGRTAPSSHPARIARSTRDSSPARGNAAAPHDARRTARGVTRTRTTPRHPAVADGRARRGATSGRRAAATPYSRLGSAAGCWATGSPGTGTSATTVSGMSLARSELEVTAVHTRSAEWHRCELYQPSMWRNRATRASSYVAKRRRASSAYPRVAKNASAKALTLLWVKSSANLVWAAMATAGTAAVATVRAAWSVSSARYTSRATKRFMRRMIPRFESPCAVRRAT